MTSPTLRIGDYVKVRYISPSNNEYLIDGTITALYGNNKAQIDNTWRFNGRDKILEHIPRMKK